MENTETHQNPLSENLEDLSPKNGPITVPQPTVDAYFTANELVIQDLLRDEARYHSLPNFCKNELPAQAIWMRRALLNWLREVCEHRNTESDVLAHTAQLIDRYLRISETDKKEYQLVGAACFLIASKLKETVPVSVEQLVQYTDFSVTRQDLLDKEIVLCISLQWDITNISPIDFIAPVIDFIPCSSKLRQLIRCSAIQIFSKVLHIEGINLKPPSYIAAACILYALQLTVVPDLNELSVYVIERIQRLLSLEGRKLRDACHYLLSLFKPGTIELTDQETSTDQGPTYQPVPSHDSLIVPQETNSQQNSENSTPYTPSSVCSSAASSSRPSCTQEIEVGTSFEKIILTKHSSSPTHPSHASWVPLVIGCNGTPTDVREVELV